MSTLATSKIINDIRIQCPGVTDAGINLELYNTVEEIWTQFLQLPLATEDPSIDAAIWGPSETQWDRYSRPIIYGTVARLQLQLGKPWSNHTLAQINQQLYQDQLYIFQGDAGNTSVTTSPTTSLYQRLLDNLRVNLPGAQDNVIKLELFNVINEFCRTTGAWQDVNPVKLVAGQGTYEITPTGTEIIDILSIAHVSLDLTGAAYSLGKLALLTTPTATDVSNGNLFVTMSLTPALDPGLDIEYWIPADMWSTHFDAFLSGMLGRMFAQAKKPYSDPKEAMFHKQRFLMLMSTKRHQVNAGNVVDGQTWRFPFFAAQRKFRRDWGGQVV